MNKIKIAICLSGEPRYWQRGSDSILSLIKTHNSNCQIDVFYHFWNTITKRQSHLINEPIIETIKPQLLLDNYKPVIGICEDKEELKPHVDVAWNYIEKLKQQHNIQQQALREGLENKDLFSKMVQTTNCPPFSQIISMCKSFTYMTEYAEKNNIHYDIIIRSRSDIEIGSISLHKLRSILTKNKLSRYIQFPSIAVRTPEGNDPIMNNIDKTQHYYHTPFVEYCFFMSSSHILNKALFEDYTNKIVKLLFRVKAKKKSEKTSVTYLSSHNCVPLFLKQNKKTQIGAPISGFKFKLKQMPMQGDIHK